MLTPKVSFLMQLQVIQYVLYVLTMLVSSDILRDNYCIFDQMKSRELLWCREGFSPPKLVSLNAYSSGGGDPLSNRESA